MSEALKAYCVTCKKMVSDDLLETADGVENNHEHRVVLFRAVGMVDPNGVIKQTFDLSPKAYFEEASRLDAELITNAVMKKLNIPLPKVMVCKLIEEVLSVVRQVVVEDMKAEKVKEKAEAMKRVKAARDKASKPKGQKGPVTETFRSEDSLTDD